MNKLTIITWTPTKAETCCQKLTQGIDQGSWVQLLPAKGAREVIPDKLLPNGPGVVITSGGSTGGPHQCLQPCKNLDLSALATGEWLRAQGITPKNCVVLNSLPMNHVSGLMPWWRSRIWGAKYHWLMPSLMRDPIALEQSCQYLLKEDIGPALISLVPTQIERLFAHPAGLRWLKSFAVIWVGGSVLSDRLAKIARSENIRLAPCYGATETAAMVTVLAPNDFLAGKTGCGSPLEDIELCLDKDGALKVKATRLAPAKWENGHLAQLRDSEGWWRSGDAAKLIKENCQIRLEILGRMDTAINSGGETVFPEKLEARLLAAAYAAKLPVKAILFIPIEDKEWGQRLVGLVRWRKNSLPHSFSKSLIALQSLVENWLPAERPVAWYQCPELISNSLGKWERSRWETWVQKLLIVENCN